MGEGAVLEQVREGGGGAEGRVEGVDDELVAWRHVGEAFQACLRHHRQRSRVCALELRLRGHRARPVVGHLLVHPVVPDVAARSEGVDADVVVPGQQVHRPARARVEPSAIVVGHEPPVHEDSDAVGASLCAESVAVEELDGQQPPPDGEEGLRCLRDEGAKRPDAVEVDVWHHGLPKERQPVDVIRHRGKRAELVSAGASLALGDEVVQAHGEAFLLRSQALNDPLLRQPPPRRPLRLHNSRPPLLARTQRDVRCLVHQRALHIHRHHALHQLLCLRICQARLVLRFVLNFMLRVERPRPLQRPRLPEAVLRATGRAVRRRAS
mmetsp:Transcript_19267/g.44204  ORF Transcript_19267/g.44204 Transcript_19267/m.44204 type:complete len:324 (-) Transcript_19267:580-1551(-)